MSQNSDSLVSYEGAVEWMRAQPELQELVGLCYLDRDNAAAARRFAASEEFEQIARWAQLKGGPRKSVLDAGCGNGIASYAMAMLGHQVTALDPDASADVGLEAARRLAPLVQEAGGEMHFVLGGVETLEFPAQTFDVVYMRQAVHHFADLEGGLRECARVLKPGGIFLATREHVVSDNQQLQQFLAEHALHHKHGGENAYPLERYIEAMRGAKLREIEVFGPWDTVVNHFPESNARAREIMAHGLRRRFKLPIDLALAIPAFETKVRKTLSARSDNPGRLYSFVARA